MLGIHTYSSKDVFKKIDECDPIYCQIYWEYSD